MIRKRVVLIAAMAAAGAVAAAPAAAQDDAGRVAAMRACGAIAKKSARLACYDAQMQAGSAAAPTAPVAAAPVVPAPIAAPAPASVPLPPAPPVAAAAPVPAPAPAVAQPPVPAPSTRALVREPRPRTEEVKEINLRAVSARDNGVGQYTITLEDGARWRMTEASPGFDPPRDGETVTIRRGALGSYLMQVHHQQAVRVVPIK